LKGQQLMFSGSSTSTLSAADKKLMGQNADRADTNQSAVPLPLLYGRQTVGLTFITDVFDVRSDAQSSGGKDGTRTGWDYYASFAAVVCFGPVLKFRNIRLNGTSVFTDDAQLRAKSLTMAANVATFTTKNPHGLTDGAQVVIYGANQPEFNGEATITVTGPNTFTYSIPGSSLPNETATTDSRIYALLKLDPVAADGADSTVITIPDFGTMEIHWGTETQPRDEYLCTASGIEHPPMAGICYIVFHKWYLGFNQKSVQNIEVEIECQPAGDWMQNPADAIIGNDCNAAAIAADILLHPRAGLALSTDEVNIDSFNNAMRIIAAEGLGVSPVWTRRDEILSMTNALFEAVDAAWTLNDSGLLAIALRRYGIPVGTVTDAQLTDLPQFEPENWSEVASSGRLDFIDADAGYASDYVEWKDQAGLAAKDRPDPLSLDRPFVTSKSVASIMASISGAVASIPRTPGTLKLAWSDALFAMLVPGALFALTHDAKPARNGMYRVVSRTIQDAAVPEFEVEIELDRTYLYSTAFESGSVETEQATMGVARSLTASANAISLDASNTRFAVVELPPALCQGTPAIAALVPRDSVQTVAAGIFLSRNYSLSGSESPDSYVKLASLNQFAWHGSVIADFPADTDCIELRRKLRLALDGPDQALPDITPFEGLSNQLLVFADSEILSVLSATMDSDGSYSLQVARGRFATQVLAHDAGEVVFLVNRSALVPISHPVLQPGNVARFKVVLGADAISDSDPFEVGITGAAWCLPPPVALCVNGRSRSAWFQPAGNIVVSWGLPDAGAPLPRADLVKAYTLLEFLLAGAVVHSELVAWPQTSFACAWPDLSTAPAQAFILRATTIVETGWDRVAGWPTSLAVTLKP
jgi:hypothetical protein